MSVYVHSFLFKKKKKARDVARQERGKGVCVCVICVPQTPMLKQTNNNRNKD